MSCKYGASAGESNTGEDKDTCDEFFSAFYSAEADATLAFDFDHFDDEANDQQSDPALGFYEVDEFKLAGKRKTSCDREDEEGPDLKRQELHDTSKSRHKAGRKPSTVEPATKRKAQNRAAQRAFRERKEKHLKNLEAKVLQLIRSQEADAEHRTLLQARIRYLQGRLAECSRTPAAELLPRHSSELIDTSHGYRYIAEVDGGQNETPERPFLGSFSPAQIDQLKGPFYQVASETNNEPVSAQRYRLLPRSSQTHLLNSATSQLDPRRGARKPTIFDYGSNAYRTIAPRPCNKENTDDESSRAGNTQFHAENDVPNGLFSSNAFMDANEKQSLSFTKERSAGLIGSSRDVWSFHNVGNGSKCSGSDNIDNGTTPGADSFSQAWLKMGHSINTSIGDWPSKHLNEQTRPMWRPSTEVNPTHWLTQPPNSSSSGGTSLTLDRTNCETSYFDKADDSAFGTYRDRQTGPSRSRTDSSDVYDEIFKAPLFPYSSPSTLFGILQPGYENADVKRTANAANTNVARPSENLLAEVQKARDEGGDEELTTDSRVFGHSQKLNGKVIDCYQIWNQLRTNIDFQEGKFDLDALCAELQAKALCTETGELVGQQKVEATFKDLRRRNVTEVNVLGPRLLFEQESWDSAIERLIASGQL